MAIKYYQYSFYSTLSIKNIYHVKFIFIKSGYLCGIMIEFKIELPASAHIVKSLEVDDLDNGLTIKTLYDKNTRFLKLHIKTNSIGSLKNVFDDFIVNYELASNIIQIGKCK